MTNWLKKAVLLLIVGFSAMFVACSQDETGNGINKMPALTALTLGEQSVISNAEHLATGDYAMADVAKGERIAMQCRACHSFEAGGVDMIGPALYGFFGKQAGSRGEFAYSTVLADAVFIWTPRSVDAWLEQSAHFLPGNRMIFPGVSDAENRRAVIAYLLKVTDDIG